MKTYLWLLLLSCAICLLGILPFFCLPMLAPYVMLAFLVAAPIVGIVLPLLSRVRLRVKVLIIFGLPSNYLAVGAGCCLCYIMP